MNITTPPTLVVTPKYKVGESAAGYLLRLSESNGYESPGFLLEYTGLTESQARNVYFSADTFHQLLGGDVKKHEKSTYKKLNRSKKGKQISVLGHQISTTDLDVKHPKICPECIKEKGYIDMFWDFKLALACPHHNILLVDHCPSCNKPLMWNRKGLSVCKCGYDLLKVRGKKITSPALLAFTELMWCKLYNQPLTSHKVKTQGLPADKLSKLSLKTLLSISQKLANTYCKTIDNQTCRDPVTVMNIASSVFNDWPNGYYEYLDALAMRLEEQNKIAATFRTYFFDLNRKISPSLLGKDTKFLKKEFIRYGNNRWKKSYIDKRLAEQIDDDLLVVGISDLANTLKIYPSTIRRLIEKKVIRVTEDKSINGKRYLFDMSHEFPTRIEEGKSLSERNAARSLGIPVSVLRILRQNELYKMHYFGNKYASYHELDVMTFKKCLLKDILIKPRTFFNNKKHILFKDVMRMKAGSSDRKAEFIAAFIQRKLVPVGILGKDVRKIIFDKARVIEFFHCADIHELKSYLVVEAAKRIKCCPTIIKDMVKKGYLEKEEVRHALRIKAISIERFLDKYISCAALAEAKGTTTKRIVNRCKGKKIKLIYFERTHSKHRQPFIKKSLVTNIEL